MSMERENLMHQLPPRHVAIGTESWVILFLRTAMSQLQGDTQHLAVPHTPSDQQILLTPPAAKSPLLLGISSLTSPCQHLLRREALTTLIQTVPPHSRLPTAMINWTGAWVDPVSFPGLPHFILTFAFTIMHALFHCCEYKWTSETCMGVSGNEARIYCNLLNK